MKMAYSLDTKLGDLLNDTKAVDVVEKYIPGISANPMLIMVKGMTLRALLNMPQAKQAGITEDAVTKVLAEINGLVK
jgi:hypothetical protein